MVRFCLGIKTCSAQVIWEKQDQIWAKILGIPKNMHSRTPKTGVTTLAEQSKQPTIVGRGRNQERAIALPPPEIFADMMAFTCSTRKLFLETA